MLCKMDIYLAFLDIGNWIINIGKWFPDIGKWPSTYIKSNDIGISGYRG